MPLTDNERAAKKAALKTIEETFEKSTAVMRAEGCQINSHFGRDRRYARVAPTPEGVCWTVVFNPNKTGNLVVIATDVATGDHLGDLDGNDI